MKRNGSGGGAPMVSIFKLANSRAVGKPSLIGKVRFARDSGLNPERLKFPRGLPLASSG